MSTFREHAERVRQAAKGHAHNVVNTVIDNAVPELRHAFREVGDKQLLRANVRTVAGSTVAGFIKDRANQSRRQGNYVLQAALMLAHKYVSGYQERTAIEQRLFENTARVRRGDTKDMSHADLRAVAEHAARYAGTGLHDKDSLKSAAEKELQDRENVRTREKEAKESGRSARMHQQNLTQRSETHEQRLAHQARVHQQKLQNIREKATTKVQAKDAARANTPKSSRPEARPQGAPNAPRPNQPIFHGKKAGVIYTKDAHGLKHYLGKKILARKAGRPAPRMPYRR